MNSARHYFFPSLLSLLVLVMATVASADEQRVRGLIDNTLEQLARSLEPMQLRVDDDYVLSADGATYTAVFQHFAVDTGEPVLEMGPLMATLTLLDAGDIRVDMQIANTLTLRDSDDTLLAELGIGGQALSTTWSESLQAFYLIGMTLDDLHWQVIDEPFSGRLGQLSVQQRLDVATDNTWQQEQDFRFNDLRLMVMDHDIRLAQLGSTTELVGRDYPQLRELLNRLTQLTEQLESLEITADDSEAAMASMGALVEVLGEVFNVISHYRGTLTGQAFTLREAKRASGGLEQFSMSSHFDQRGELPEMGFSMAMEGVSSPMQSMPTTVLPRSARFELRLRHIPKDLSQRLVNIAIEGSGVPSDLQGLFWQQQLLGLLMDSRLELQIPDTFVATDLSRADLTLRAAVAPDAAFGSVGELNLYITNMQQLIEATGAGQNPTIAPMLAMITAFAERRVGDNDQTVDVFELAITEQGRLMLNNKDITALFMPNSPAR